MDISSILSRAGTLKIAVVGDLIMDTYLFGEVNRVSPEAPIMVLEKRETKTTMGGAGNVFQNLIGLGVDAHLYCNFDGHPFWDFNLNDKIFCNPYPSSRKTRIMSGNHHLLRIDEELGPQDMPGQTYKQMSWWKTFMESFEEYDAIIFADYHKGVLSDSVINTIMEFATLFPRKIIVDTKKDFDRYHGAHIIKCNKKEWEARPVPFRRPKCQWMVVTCGEAGISYYDKEGNGSGIAGIPVNIVDVCGAGDTVTAALAVLACDAKNDIHEFYINRAVEFANLCASEVVKHPGVYPIQKSDFK